MTENSERIEFVIGEEVPFEQIIFSAGLKNLLQTVLSSGAKAIAITDTHGRFILSDGYPKDIKNLSTDIMNTILSNIYSGNHWITEHIYYEGEHVGYLVIEFKESDKAYFEALIKIISSSLKTIIFNTSKRLVTTELHTTTVKRSYEELVAMYDNLAQSEKRYRELSQNLEQKVQERTEELKKAYIMMIQKEKMASIGQLASGIAHEINNPISYIISNLQSLKKYLKSFDEFVTIFVNHYQHYKSLQEAFTRLKISYKLQDSNEIIAQCLEGADKIKKIVVDLKGFSHIDEAERRDVNINEEIDKILNVLYHEIQNRSATIVKHYGIIPTIYANPNLLCQVFMNLILNALQSKDKEVCILITTSVKGHYLSISIKDDGEGISDSIKNRIFEPFFTTKDVGSGAGLGLSVVYEIIKTMDGIVDFVSEVGKGTEFVVKLPIIGDKVG